MSCIFLQYKMTINQAILFPQKKNFIEKNKEFHYEDEIYDQNEEYSCWQQEPERGLPTAQMSALISKL